MPKPYGELDVEASPLETAKAGYPQWVIRKPECPTCGGEGEILGVFRRRGDAEICAEALGTIKNEG